jgi:hypothetical protein
MEVCFEHTKIPKVSWQLVLIGIEQMFLPYKNMISLYIILGRHRFEANFIYNKNNGN